jgi:hypothetical protein
VPSPAVPEAGTAVRMRPHAGRLPGAEGRPGGPGVTSVHADDRDGADPAQARRMSMLRRPLGRGQPLPFRLGPDAEPAEHRDGCDEQGPGRFIGLGSFEGRSRRAGATGVAHGRSSLDGGVVTSRSAPSETGAKSLRARALRARLGARRPWRGPRRDHRTTSADWQFGRADSRMPAREDARAAPTFDKCRPIVLGLGVRHGGRSR